MSREKMIEQKLNAIEDLRKEINLLSKLEHKRLYDNWAFYQKRLKGKKVCTI
jgi:hypothetical protein